MAMSHNLPQWHAEETLLRQIHLNAVQGPVHVYVYRENANGTPATSRPCTNCMQMLINSKGVSSVTFYDEHGNQRTMRLL